MFKILARFLQNFILKQRLSLVNFKQVWLFWETISEQATNFHLLLKAVSVTGESLLLVRNKTIIIVLTKKYVKNILCSFCCSLFCYP